MLNGKTINENGTFYYVNDALDRDDGPAAILNSGSKFWFKNDKLHRIDGPAVVFGDAIQWFFNGKEIYANSLEDFKKIINQMVLK